MLKVGIVVVWLKRIKRFSLSIKLPWWLSRQTFSKLMKPKIRARGCALFKAPGPTHASVGREVRREHLQWLLGTHQVCAPVWHLCCFSCRQGSLSYMPFSWRSSTASKKMRLPSATFTQVRSEFGRGEAGGIKVYILFEELYFMKNTF